MKDIRLYIGGVRADLPEDVKIPMNYTLEDRTNPTVVKTSYSKTISLPGTKTNNGIFNFFKLDRTLAYGDSITGANFDPSKRCEFVLYVNGDLFESGYLKLDKVKNVDGKLQYDVTLYGGLGDYFYNLSYGEDGEKKSLADLYYGVTSDKEAELDFTITKDTVNTAWNSLGSTGNTLWDTINFAPAYNGIPDTIDGKKVLVNTCGTTAFSTAFTEDDVTYGTQDGYCMVEMKSEKDEWEMRDLRSHLQRPVVRMKSVLNACFNPENNKGETTTGYTVDLDETFFNSDNPYWEDAWVTLPPLSTDAESDVTTSDSDVTFADAVTGPYAGQASTQPLIISGADLNSVSGVLDLSSYPFSYVNLSTVIGLKADVTGTTNNLSLTRYEYWNTWIWFWKERWEGRGVAVQMVAYNNDDNRPIAGSDIYILKGNNTDIQPEDFVGTQEGQYNPIFPGAIAGVLGYFKYDQTEHKHIFVADNFTQWQISIQKCPKVEHLKIVLYVQNVYTAAGDSPRGSNGWGWDLMKDRLWDAVGSNMYTADTRVVCTLAGKASLTEPSSIASGSKLTKAKLLSTESTPADYLLSYAKTFGLYFYKDPYANRIFIRTRNKFFYPYVEDINDLIDRSKEMVTVPNVFNHKWYSMTQDQEDSKYEERYYNDWGVQYGQQRINTNYNFDSETQELMDNVFKGGITARERSSYLREYFLPDGTSAPSFFAEGYEQTLYGTGTTEHKEEIMSSVLDWSNVVDIYDVPAADATPKVCFYDKERKPIDMKDVLLFYNGKKSSYDKAGNQIVYWLTDDIGKMTVLNDGTCWLYTAQSTDALGETIAIPVTSLPMFTRVVIDENKVMKTMDFGDPKELYVDNWMLSERSSIYSQFWKDYLQDQYDVNTKVLTCYVHWDRKVIDDMQRRFYWFDNTIWVLNKIQDYDLAGDGATKCEFIRVNNPQAYTYGQLTAIPRIDTPTDVDGTRPAPAPSNLRRVKRSGDCPVIEFEDIITESYAVEAFDGNYDGYLDMCEAASVTDIGLTFKGTPIGLFDEFIYFTGIDTIPEGGFSGCTSLEHIVIPDNVTFIGGNAFYGDTNLEYIQILSSKPQTLGPGAFDNTRDCPIVVPCDYINSFREQWPQYANRLYCTLPKIRVTPMSIHVPWEGGDYTFEIVTQAVSGVSYSIYSGNLDYTINLSGNTGYVSVNPHLYTTSGTSVIRLYGYDEYGREVQTFFTINQDGYIPVTAITLSVSDVCKEGVASYTYSPATANRFNFQYSSSDTSKATITSGGTITALDNGQTNICVTDTVSSVSDCQTVNVMKYITGLTINVPAAVTGSTQVTYTASPSCVDTDISYSVIGTGVTVDSNGFLSVTTVGTTEVTVCVTDNNSGLQDCATVMCTGNYLTLDIVSGGTIQVTGFTITGSSESPIITTIPKQVDYILNGVGGWQPLTSINVSDGDVVYLKSDGNYSSSIEIPTIPMFPKNTPRIFFSGSTAYFNVKGDIKSMFYGVSDADYRKASFYSLFYKTNVISAEDLELPDFTTELCYTSMFDYCNSLTTTPELPATTLSDACYRNMFGHCQSLTTPPVLPATTMADYCYWDMFYQCAGLTSAPVLPATTLGVWCYNNMFNGCQNLTTPPALPATTLAEGCYYYMFASCYKLETAPVLPATALTVNCYDHMFQDCRKITTAPALPATTLAPQCYGHMFDGCTSLTSVPATLPATTLEEICYYGMFYNCSSLTTAPALPATTMRAGCYEDMFKGCTSLTTAPALPATTLAPSCYKGMFSGVRRLTVAPELPATRLYEECYMGMFENCWLLESAPELPATRRAVNGYHTMFKGCSRLRYIKCLLTGSSSSYTYSSDWVDGVSSSGTFVKSAGAPWVTGKNGIPSGWTVQEV